MSESIPVVDLRDYVSSDADRRARFVRTLGDALERFGFVQVVGHGVDPALIARSYDLARRVFALPEAAKKRCETPQDGRQRGYTSFGVEHAKDTTIPDLKEFWHVGRVLPADHPLTIVGDIPPNQFPAELPESGPVFLELYTALEDFAWRLLDAIGEHLGQPPAYFRAMVKDGNSVLRVIHYPDVGGDAPVGAIRAAQHEDINLLTVLPASTRSGLELMTRDGRWIPIDSPPDVLICDTGDMMQVLTGGRLPATTHRVVNPAGGSDGGRLSMPFFLHPHSDFVLAPAGGGGTPIKTRDYLLQRLREIGVA